MISTLVVQEATPIGKLYNPERRAVHAEKAWVWTGVVCCEEERRLFWVMQVVNLGMKTRVILFLGTPCWHAFIVQDSTCFEVAHELRCLIS